MSDSPAPQAEHHLCALPAWWQRLVRHQHALAAFAGLLLFSVALWVLHHELAGLHAADIRTALGLLGAWQLAGALLATAVSYLALTGYDVLALRILSHPLPYRRVALASFMATAVGHNLGLAVVSAGAVRARLYIAWGLSATEVAAMIALVGLTLGVGLAFAGGLALLLEPALASALLRLAPGAVQALGGSLVVLALAYVLAGSVRKTPVLWRHWRVHLPASGMAWQQLGLAVVDVAAAATVLYLLLGPQPGVSWPVFVAVYALALVAGIASHVPGGLGVFETVMLLALPLVPRDTLLAAIVLYRVVYFLVPLALAMLLAGGMAARSQRHRLAWQVQQARGSVRGMRRLLTWAAPTVSSAAVFLTGAVLLFSGSLPAERSRLHWLHAMLPLPVLELSHLAGSLVGLALVILAHGLYRRVDASYRLTAWLLAAGAALSLLRGLNVASAGLALVVLAGLYLSRSAFHRRAAWWSAGASPAALAGLLAVLGATVWLGLLSYQQVAYSDALWWEFALHGDAPRFLRASLLVAVVLLAWLLWRWLQPRRPEPAQPDAAELERAARLVAASPHAEAALALVGDKRLLFDEQDRAFLMYQVRGRSWIAMGDPVGDAQAGEALVWRFRELADQHGARPVFYQVEAAGIGRYLDLGLGAIKIGEEALVPLAGFSLSGSTRADLRRAHHRGQRDGLAFEVVPTLRDQPALLAELARVSDAWLADKHTREKGFSVGRFDPDYLARFPCALVRQEGRVVAFANLWLSGEKHELSIDLMRHLSGVSGAVMDFLFVELMLWGAQQGYAQFNLGMAPLSGLETHPLAPLWHRLGTLLYRHGEHFYNFQGLRAYKVKFAPRWQPKYLMAPGGLGLPAVLLDVAALISGGLKGLVWR
jgi:phosphatidylglycerol lysyltransferase